MNEQIKFRAWDREDKVMRSWEELMLNKESGKDSWFIGYPESKYTTKFDHKQELIQYTGLHDKNGKEIYDKDIAKVKHLDGSIDIREIGARDYEFLAYFSLGNCKLEIIGNIYENPELLEVD